MSLKRKIGKVLLILVIMLGAIIVASGFYIRIQARSAMDAVIASGLYPVVKSPSADVNIVAFVDYERLLSYTSYQAMLEAAALDTKVNIHVRPIATSYASELMAALILAAYAIDEKKAAELNQQILRSNKLVDITTARRMATDLGFNQVELLIKMDGALVKDGLLTNATQFKHIGFSMPPGFLIGNKGYIPNPTRVESVNTWVLMIDDARQRTKDKE